MASKADATPLSPASTGFGARRRGGHGPRALAAGLSAVTRHLLGKRGFAGEDMLARWPSVVGAELAAQAAPVRLSFPRGKREGGTLEIRVAGSAAATLLQHRAPLVLERINGFFGYAAVTRLKLSHGPMPRPAAASTPAPRPLRPEEEASLQRNLGGIADETLQDALRRLGRAVLGRRH